MDFCFFVVFCCNYYSFPLKQMILMINMILISSSIFESYVEFPLLFLFLPQIFYSLLKFLYYIDSKNHISREPVCSKTFNNTSASFFTLFVNQRFLQDLYKESLHLKYLCIVNFMNVLEWFGEFKWFVWNYI